ncbi:c-type cytochrome [Thalassospira sp.]|uniref:c-type cytochrome n=1 Tax=Thalassospira sp. TaxID=1912094 RepID=UPI003AA93836
MFRKSSGLARKLSIWLAALAVLGVAGFVVLTSPWTWSLLYPTPDVADAGPANLENGREMFLAGDCSTCHATPGKKDPLDLGGGHALTTDFGTFYMPNISPDKTDGIGNWTLAEFTRALREGVGPDSIMPDGENLYPAFPYTSYQHMTANDVRDLFAYLNTLDPVQSQVPPHDLKFPFNMRRGVGVWRLAFLNGKQVVDGQPKPLEVAPVNNDPMKPVDILSKSEDILARGRYLVEGAGHCAECHSPRTIAGNIPSDMRFSGGPQVSGVGYYPNITPSETGIGSWTANEITNYLKSGVSPVGQIAAGDMAEVIENTSQLSTADRYAIAVYLKTLPAVDHPAPGVPEPNRTSKLVMLPKQKAKPVVLPVSSPEDIAQAKTVNVVYTKSLFLDPADVTKADAEPAGKLIGGTEMEILERKDDLIKVKITGWQPEGVKAVLYALKGQRILEAVLDKSAIAALETGKIEISANTGQTWGQASLTGWTKADGVIVNTEKLWDFSSALFNKTCSACHTQPETGAYLANQWVGTINAMRRFTSLNDDQYHLVLAYLQNHSKDVNPDGEGEK